VTTTRSVSKMMNNQTPMRSSISRKKKPYRVTKQTPSRIHSRNTVDVLRSINEDLEESFSYRGLLQLSSKPKLPTAVKTIPTQTKRNYYNNILNNNNKSIQRVVGWKRLLSMSRKQKRRRRSMSL